METKDLITIVSVFSIVVGWFVNSWLNRRHEIAKKRMELRLEALLSFLPVLFAIQENQTTNDNFKQDITSCRTKFQLYCYNNEIQEFEKIVTAIENKDENIDIKYLEIF